MTRKKAKNRKREKQKGNKKRDRSKNKLSTGEICAANFIPPVNGASLVIYFCV